MTTTGNQPNSQPNPTTSTLRKAGLFYLVFVMFSYTTGGPFGLEDMVTTSGPGLTLLFLLVLPFFWCIPVSLVSAELTTAMPVEGGFYRWTRAAFGDFWGFLAGWWNWSASFLLGGAYAVLFTDYLVYYFPQMTWWQHYLISVALIAVLTWVNVRGIQMVGQVATALEIFIFIPVLTMIVLGLAHWHHNPFSPFIPPHQPTFKVFGVGLALGLWLYSGYEQLSTRRRRGGEPAARLSARTRSGRSAIDRRIFSPNPRGPRLGRQLGTMAYGYFSEAAAIIGGSLRGRPWLGTWMTVAAMVGNVALLNSTVLTTTRMPFAMAEDGYLPEVLTRKHPRYGTPWLAITRVGGHLRASRLAEPRRNHLRLHLAALGDDRSDSALSVETPSHAARSAASLRDSRRSNWIALRGRRAGTHGDGRSVRQRPLRRRRRCSRNRGGPGGVSAAGKAAQF